MCFVDPDATCGLPDVTGLVYPPTLTPNSGPIAYLDNVTLTCSEHRPTPLIRQRQCLYDQTTDSYNVIRDDTLECPSM